MGDQMRESMIVKILELSKHGATMTKLTRDLSMTHRQLRRIMAELVDRGLLRFTFTNQGYITTHKEYIFLDGSKTKTRYSQRNNRPVHTVHTMKDIKVTKESIDTKQRNRRITMSNRNKNKGKKFSGIIT